MEIIRQESKWFSSHLVRQPRKDCDYRKSNFVVRLEIPDGLLLYNVLSGALYLLQNEDETQLLDTLIENWFYVPDDFNELDWVDFLRNKKRKNFNSKNISGYTIMTTLDCNARCFYCYEKGRPRTMMSEQTAVDLANYIIENAKGKPVRISWFGGEPLVNYKVIDIICDKLSLSEVKYTSTMISNGLLFTPSLVECAVEKWNLKKVQITLDGTKEVYLKSKAFVHSDGTEFDKVLDNIELLLKNKISVSIRLNQDLYNTENLLQLIDLLKDRFSGYPKLKAYNHLLFNDDNSVSEEQERCYYRLSDKIVSSHLSSKAKLEYGVRQNNCMADSPSSRVITPDGKIGKCEHYSSELLIGSIYDNNTDESMMSKWTERIDRPFECNTCTLYPICCKIKMCPNENPNCNDFERGSRLSSLKNAVLNVYDEYCKKGKS